MTGGFFVAGTDTGVGKTVVSAALVRAFVSHGYRVAGLKPVASGCDMTPDGPRNEDALLLQACANTELPYDRVNPCAFLPPIAPHIAAARENVIIKTANLIQNVSNVRDYAEIVIVEGVGGWLVPINEHETMADLAKALKLPVVLVVGIRLGCINHALLTAQAIRQSGLKLAGWVANHIDPDFSGDLSTCQANIETITQQLAAPCLCEIPYQDAKLNTVEEIDNLNIRFPLAAMS